MKTQLAFILSHLLETNNIDTKELSKKIEVVRGHLNDIKNGQDVEVSLSVLTKIAAHFDVTLDYLVYGMPMVKDLDKPQGINWQPIEEFTADSIKDIEVNDWLFYSDTDTKGPKVYTIVIGMQNTYVNFQSFTYTVDGLCTLNHDELIVFIKDRNITYFAELTVPEVK